MSDGNAGDVKGVLSDPRVDKVVSLVLSGVAAIALSFGAWFFSNMSEEIKELNKAVSDLRVEIALSKTMDTRLNSIDARLTVLEREVRKP